MRMRGKILHAHSKPKHDVEVLRGRIAQRLPGFQIEGDGGRDKQALMVDGQSRLARLETAERSDVERTNYGKPD